MSAEATFELPAGLDYQALLLKVRAIWTEHDVRLLDDPRSPPTLHLAYYYGPNQATELMEIARLLLGTCNGLPLYYYREWGVCVPGETPDYPRPLSVTELSSQDFCPAMHDGIHYRYRVVAGAESRSL